MSHLILAVVSAVAQVALNAALLAYFFGKLAQRVEVLWLAVFNHLGQDAEAVQHECQRLRQERRNPSRRS